MELNNQDLSYKRKVLQIIFSIILYILGLYYLLNFFNSYYRYSISTLTIINFVLTALEIILSSIMIYFTVKNRSSRNVCTWIISLLICIIISILILFSILIGSFNFIYIIYSSFFIIVFIFNLKTKNCSCFD